MFSTIGCCGPISPGCRVKTLRGEISGNGMLQDRSDRRKMVHATAMSPQRPAPACNVLFGPPTKARPARSARGCPVANSSACRPVLTARCGDRIERTRPTVDSHIFVIGENPRLPCGCPKDLRCCSVTTSGRTKLPFSSRGLGQGPRPFLINGFQNLLPDTLSGLRYVHLGIQRQKFSESKVAVTFGERSKCRVTLSWTGNS